MALPVALQLFSLEKDLNEDLDGTLKFVKELGFDGVELSGNYGHEAEEVYETIKKYDLAVPSYHIDVETFFYNDIDMLFKRYTGSGCKYLVAAYLYEERRPGTPGFPGTVEKLTEIAKKAKENNMSLLYHNHDFEFRIKTESGKCGFDEIMDSIPKDLMQTEMDVCWVHASGTDPVEYIKKYSDRAPLIHLKNYYVDEKIANEYRSTEGKHLLSCPELDFRSLDNGLVDIKSVVEAAYNANTEYLVIEQDRPTEGKTAKECVERSMNYLKTINK